MNLNKYRFMETSYKFKYFISYSRLDIAIVKNIVSQIEYAIDREVWIDYTGIETASDFREKIINAIDSCDKVFFMLSSNSMESKFAKQVIIYAKNIGKPVVPICIDDTKLSGWFLFEFGQVDYVTFAINEQKEKFMKDLFRWEGKTTDLEKLSVIMDSNFKMIGNTTMISQDPAGRDLREIGDDHFYGRNGYPIDYHKAFIFYEQASKLGDVRSINYLGNYYYRGLLNHIDYVKSVEYYLIAAEKGYAPAQNNLANCYFEGQGVEKNFDDAVKWYKSAAEQFHIEALVSLAECYYFGYGVKEDKSDAYSLFLKAEELGSIEALCSIGEFYYHGYVVERDRYRAFELFEKAANGGSINAQYNLGYCYKMGHGTIHDNNKAYYWFLKAAEQGHEFAKKEIHE